MPKQSEKAMKTIEIGNEIENINIQIHELSKLITDLRVMRLATESMELMKEYKELFIYKSSEMLNVFFEKFDNMERTIDDTAFYFQNLVEKLEKHA